MVNVGISSVHLSVHTIDSELRVQDAHPRNFIQVVAPTPGEARLQSLTEDVKGQTHGIGNDTKPSDKHGRQELLFTYAREAKAAFRCTFYDNSTFMHDQRLVSGRPLLWQDLEHDRTFC
jgi:hypothetical protein